MQRLLNRRERLKLPLKASRGGRDGSEGSMVLISDGRALARENNHYYKPDRVCRCLVLVPNVKLHRWAVFAPRR